MKTTKLLMAAGIATLVCQSLVVKADIERYKECRTFARDISGYRGPLPAERKSQGGALEGALKGAAAGAAIGWVTDSDKGKAAKRGAAIGGLIGAIRKAEARKKREENEEKRRAYEIELTACMSG